MSCRMYAFFDMYCHNCICNSSKFVYLHIVAIRSLLCLFLTEVSKLDQVEHYINDQKLELKPLVSIIYLNYFKR